LNIFEKCNKEFYHGERIEIMPHLVAASNLGLFDELLHLNFQKLLRKRSNKVMEFWE
jgi:hypothetical protein